jgi:hypothetical protein
VRSGAPGIKTLKIQASDQFPDRPRWMVFSDQSFHVEGPPTHLLAIDPAD